MSQDIKNGKDKIIEKIKKCFALGKSSNEHEAALAMKKAQELMAGHNINSVDIEISCVKSKDSEISKTVKPPRYLVFLAQMIAEVFGCHVVVSLKYEFTKSCKMAPRNRIIFIGVMHRAEISAYAFDVLRRKLIKSRKDYIKKHWKLNKPTVTRRADLFAEAWVFGARSKVKPLVFSERETEIIEAWKEKQYGEIGQAKLKKPAKKQRGDDDAIHDGYFTGKDVDIYHGVAGACQTMMIQ